MLNLIAPLALSCTLFAAPQDARPELRQTPPGMTQQMIHTILDTKMDKHLRYSLYVPKKVGALSLLQYAEELSSERVGFYEISIEGDLVSNDRPRFLMMRDAIAVQDFDGGLEQGLKLLAELDDSLGAATDAPANASQEVVTTYQLLTLSQTAASSLLDLAHPTVAISYIPETNLIGLRGQAADVEAAKATLDSANQPHPQVLLSWTLYEAVAAADLDPDRKAPTDLAAAIAPFAPGKVFQSAGTFMVRGAAGGDTQLRVASSLKDLKGMANELPSEITLSANASGWNPETQSLNLSHCEIVLQLSRFVELTDSKGNTTKSTRMSTDQLATSLSIRAGETTVVGSMGGDPVFVALTMTLL